MSQPMQEELDYDEEERIASEFIEMEPSRKEKARARSSGVAPSKEAKRKPRLPSPNEQGVGSSHSAKPKQPPQGRGKSMKVLRKVMGEGKKSGKKEEGSNSRSSSSSEDDDQDENGPGASEEVSDEENGEDSGGEDDGEEPEEGEVESNHENEEAAEAKSERKGPRIRYGSKHEQVEETSQAKEKERYECRECTKTYAWKGGLRKHYKDCHPNQRIPESPPRRRQASPPLAKNNCTKGKHSVEKSRGEKKESQASRSKEKSRGRDPERSPSPKRGNGGVGGSRKRVKSPSESPPRKRRSPPRDSPPRGPPRGVLGRLERAKSAAPEQGGARRYVVFRGDQLARDLPAIPRHDPVNKHKLAQRLAYFAGDLLKNTYTDAVIVTRADQLREMLRLYANELRSNPTILRS